MERNQAAFPFVFTVGVEMGVEESLENHSPPAGWETWYRQCWAPLIRSAWLMCGSRETAEDAVHDAFLRLYRSSVIPDNPMSYLRRTVVNLLADKSRRERRVAIQDIVDEVSELEPEEMNTWYLVSKLPVRQRQALVLRYADDLGLAVIAQAMSCSESAAKSLIHRGLEALREEMGRHGEY